MNSYSQLNWPLAEKWLKVKIHVIFPAGTMCLNTGWGYTHPAGWGSPDELQVVSIPIIEQETCVNIYQDIGLVYDGEICAGGPDQGACNVR